MASAEKLGSDAVGVPLGIRTRALIHGPEEKEHKRAPEGGSALLWVAAVVCGGLSALFLGVGRDDTARIVGLIFGGVGVALGRAALGVGRLPHN